VQTVTPDMVTEPLRFRDRSDRPLVIALPRLVHAQIPAELFRNALSKIRCKVRNVLRE
jgi:hypothetical protein